MTGTSGRPGPSTDPAGWAEAHWNDLVRVLLAAGLDVELAESGAQRALVRVWPHLDTELADGDADVLVHRELLVALPSGSGTAASDARDELLGEVLTSGVGLTGFQAEQVLGRYVPDPLTSRGPDWPDSYRGTLPLPAILRDVAALRRRARRRGLLVAAALVVLLLVATGVAALVRHPGDDPATARPPAVAGDGPPPTGAAAVPLAWWSHGQLHLLGHVISAPGLTRLVQVGSGAQARAVWSDAGGSVYQSDPDGDTLRVGVSLPGSPLAGSSGTGALWVEPRPHGTARLTLWDTRFHVETAGIDVARSTRVTGLSTDALAAAGDAVATVRTESGPAVWRPGSGGLRAGRPSLPPPTNTRDRATVGGISASWQPGRPGVRLRGGPEGITGIVRPRLPVDQAVLTARFAPSGELVVVTRQVFQLSFGTPGSEMFAGHEPIADLSVCGPTSGSCRVVVSRSLDGPFQRSPVVLAG